MVNDPGQEPSKPDLCTVCLECAAKLDLHICGHCGHVRVDNAQNTRFTLVELYRALGVFLAAGPRENLDDLMEATQAIIDKTRQTMNV